MKSGALPEAVTRVEAIQIHCVSGKESSGAGSQKTWPTLTLNGALGQALVKNEESNRFSFHTANACTPLWSGRYALDCESREREFPFKGN